jgi:hypothetical protein
MVLCPITDLKNRGKSLSGTLSGNPLLTAPSVPGCGGSKHHALKKVVNVKLK